MNNLTHLTPEGFLVISSDTHISKWVQDSKRLDIQDGQITPWLSSLQPSGTAIDIGAFIGDTAASISRRLSSSGTLICIEPYPLAYSCLTHNIATLAPSCKVITHNLGLSSSQTSGSYILSPNTGASHITLDSSAPRPTYLPPIPLTTLDSLLASGTPQETIPDFIKIDVEGFESNVLLGAHLTLSLHHPDLLIEVNSEALLRAGSSRSHLFQILASHGYSFKITDPSAVSSDPQYDIFCTAS